jgi:hypothetical protein
MNRLLSGAPQWTEFIQKSLTVGAFGIMVALLLAIGIGWRFSAPRPAKTPD